MRESGGRGDDPDLEREISGLHIIDNTITPVPTAAKFFLERKPQYLIDRLAKLAPLELGNPKMPRKP